MRLALFLAVEAAILGFGIWWITRPSGTEVLRRIRVRCQLTTAELAEVLEVDPVELVMIDKGQAYPNTELARRMIKLLMD